MANKEQSENRGKESMVHEETNYSANKDSDDVENSSLMNEEERRKVEGKGQLGSC